MNLIGRLCVFLAIACGASPLTAWADASADALIGLWGAQETLGPAVSGDLALERHGTQWHATIAGYDAVVQQHGDELHFTLPDNQGEFRGRLRRGTSLQGHWIQPAGRFNNNRYASPVRLEGAGEQRWKGQVRPLEERLTVYVSVQRMADGSITAILRNPEGK